MHDTRNFEKEKVNRNQESFQQSLSSVPTTKDQNPWSILPSWPAGQIQVNSSWQVSLPQTWIVWSNYKREWLRANIRSSSLISFLPSLSVSLYVSSTFSTVDSQPSVSFDLSVCIFQSSCPILTRSATHPRSLRHRNSFVNSTTNHPIPCSLFIIYTQSGRKSGQESLDRGACSKGNTFDPTAFRWTRFRVDLAPWRFTARWFH